MSKMAVSNINIRRAINRASFGLGAAAYKSGITRRAYNIAASAIELPGKKIPGYKYGLTRSKLLLAERSAVKPEKIEAGEILSSFILQDPNLRREFMPIPVTEDEGAIKPAVIGKMPALNSSPAPEFPILESIINLNDNNN
jgi:hypothetical protein